MSQIPYQKRAEWDNSIKELANREALHVHTLILPPGVTPDDPRLKYGRVVSENNYVTDHFSFPDFKFHGDINPILNTNPAGPRLVLSPSNSQDLSQLETSNAGGVSKSQNTSGYVDTVASEAGSALTRSNIPSHIPSPMPAESEQQRSRNKGLQELEASHRQQMTSDAYYKSNPYFDPSCETCRRFQSSHARETTQSTTAGPSSHTWPSAGDNKLEGSRPIGQDRPVDFTYQYIEIPRELKEQKGDRKSANNITYTIKELTDNTHSVAGRYVDPIPSVGARLENQWYRMADDRNTSGPGTYVLGRGHGLGWQPRNQNVTPVHRWDVDYTPGNPTTYMTFNQQYIGSNQSPNSGMPPRDSGTSRSASTRGWRWWPFGRGDNASTGDSMWENEQLAYEQLAWQRRAEWQRQIEDLSYVQPLHIHTILVPPGMSINDPRLRDAKVISQESYWTDRPIFPNGNFLGDIRNLPANPSGPRMVG